MGDPTKREPIDTPTEATVSFIESSVVKGSTIIEVGCGTGHVAASLANRGYSVIAIDSDLDSVALGRQNGVDVIFGTWPDVDVECVDAVAFTRSLHHISHLHEAISKVRDVLQPAGILLVEDFAFDDLGAPEKEWLLTTVSSPMGCSLITPVPGEYITGLINSDEAADEPATHNAHDLHSVSQMTLAIEKFFDLRETCRVPYL